MPPKDLNADPAFPFWNPFRPETGQIKPAKSREPHPSTGVDTTHHARAPSSKSTTSMIPPRRQQALGGLLAVALAVSTTTTMTTTVQGFGFAPAATPLSTTPATPAAPRWTSVTAGGSRRRQGMRVLMQMKVKFNPREDYYKRLGIERTASINDVKRAYRRLGAFVDGASP